MKKKSMKDALGKSIQAEELAVKDRFEKADTVMGLTPKGPKAVEKKPVIRDTFTIPDFDYELFAQLQDRLLSLGKSVNKSELVRAGLHALFAMKNQDLLNQVAGITKIKTGRPLESYNKFQQKKP